MFALRLIARPGLRALTGSRCIPSECIAPVVSMQHRHIISNADYPEGKVYVDMMSHLVKQKKKEKGPTANFPEGVEIDKELFDTLPVLKATARHKLKKYATAKLREEGLMPGVITGLGDNGRRTIQNITLSFIEFQKLMRRSGKSLYATLIALEVHGKTELVLVREIYYEPVRLNPNSVTFVRFNSKKPIPIPLEITNEDASPAIKRGGYMNFVVPKIACKVEGFNIPKTLDINVAGKEMNTRIYLKDLDIPPNVHPLERYEGKVLAKVTGSRRLKVQEEPSGGAS